MKERKYLELKKPQKPAKNMIEKLDTWHEAIINGSRDAIFISDVEANFIMVNTAACRLTGFSEQELLKMKIPDLHETQDLQAFLLFHNKIMSGEEILTESKIKQKNGQKVDVEFNNTRIIINGVHYMHSSARDITERKLADDILRESEEKFKTIFNESTIGIELYQADGKQIEANKASLEMFGIPDISEIKEFNLFEGTSLNPERQKKLRQGKSISYQAIFNFEKVKELAQYRTNKSGIAHLDYIITPIFGTKEHLIKGFLLQVQDITERKLADEELQKSRNELHEYFENDISANYVVSVKGEILNCNKTFLGLFGFKNKLDTEKISMARLYKNPKEGKEIIRLIAQNKKIENYEVDFISKNGKIINTIINATGIFNDTGELIKVQGYVVDISDRKQAEIALKENKELFALFMHHSPIYTFIKEVTATESRVIQASDNFREMIGIHGSEIIGKTMDELFPAEFASKISKDDWTVVKKGKILQLDEDFNGRNYTTIKFPISQGEKKLLAGYTIDITERKLAEDKIREKDIQFRKLSANVPDLIYQFTRRPDGSYFVPVASEGIKNIFGCFPEDVVDDFTPIANVIYPEDIARVIRDIEYSAKHLTFFSCEFRVQIPGKDIQWIYSKSTPEKLEDGSITWYGFNVDITLQKNTEEELKKKNAFIQTVLDNLPIGIALNEIDKGNAFYINKKFEEIYGWPADEMKDISSFFEKIYPDKKYREELKTNILTDIQSGDITRMHWEDCVITHKDGSKHIINAVNIPLFEQNIMVSTVTDITGRKRAEEEILVLAHSLKSVNECVSITDFENKIIFLNESFLKTYGYTEDELRGKTIEIVGSKKNAPGIINEVYQATLQGGWQGELINTKKDRSEFPIFLSTTVIKDKSDKPLGLIGVASDITERRNKEKELIQAKDKAEESDRLKSAFLANMSHEIRTPMNGILGFAELLKEPKLTGEEQQKYIHIIEKSGERMLNIINDIINISKVEAGQMEISFTETNINEQIEDIYTFFQPEIEKKGVQFSFKNSLPSKRSIIKTDREKIYAILTNLVKNAIKFTKTGSIEFGYRLVETSNSVSLLEFFVKDTGTGIPAEKKEIIFERFRQGNDLLNKGYEGSGLGLTISKAYVEMLGGKIWVESEEGLGSVFYFTVPYHTKTEGHSYSNEKMLAEDETNQFNPKISGLKVLVVEDDEPSEILIRKIIKDYSKDVLIAKNGIEAIDICRNIPDLDLILMDMKMPTMDGYEATRKIRQFNNEVTIIAQTAYALAGERENALNAGCNDYISKPINRVLLAELMQKYFNA